MSLKRIALPLLLGAFLAVGVYTLNFARAKHGKPASSQSNQTVPFTQKITSCVKGIRVVKAEITDAGTPNAAAEVQIENLSNLGIVAVSLEATNGVETYTVAVHRQFEGDKPIVVIKPRQTYTLNMSLHLGNVPLQIGGVIYEDGTEEGCTSPLETLHELEEAEKSKNGVSR